MGGRSGGNVSNMFTFALVALFAILALLLAVIGIDVYQRVLHSADSNNQARASLNYVANKLRAGDVEGQVALEQREGLPVLVLRDPNAPDYDLSFYYYNSTLMEHYEHAGEVFLPGDGEALVELSAYDVTETAPGLLSFSVATTEGQDFSMHVALRTAQAEGGTQ